MTVSVLDCRDPQDWPAAIEAAHSALTGGELVVIPTDTVYGVAADPAVPGAVASLLSAKERSRDMPPPVLVPDRESLSTLAVDIPAAAGQLVDHYWPGALTVICRATPALAWDLGETHGTIAVRMPDHPLTLALLARTGPLAVSSANKSARPAATEITNAVGQLGNAVAIYLDAGQMPTGSPSTIVDFTVTPARVVRQGDLTTADLSSLEQHLSANQSTGR